MLTNYYQSIVQSDIALDELDETSEDSRVGNGSSLDLISHSARGRVRRGETLRYKVVIELLPSPGLPGEEVSVLINATNMLVGVLILVSIIQNITT